LINKFDDAGKPDPAQFRKALALALWRVKVYRKSVIEPKMAALHALLCGRITECFFFDTVIVCTGFTAKAPDVVQRLIAIPASAFRLQCGHAHRAYDPILTTRLALLFSMVCVTHDSAATP
jgi:hypothetical protein